MKYGIALVLALVLNASANLMMKIGVRRFDGSPLSLEHGLGPAVSALATNWVLGLGIICFATNVLLYTYALAAIRISVAYPIMVSTGFAIIAVVAWKYLGETLSAGQWVGVGLILVGVVLVAREMQAAPGA